MNQNSEILWKVESNDIIGISKRSFIMRMVLGSILVIIILLPSAGLSLDFFVLLIIIAVALLFFFYLAAIDNGWFFKPEFVEYSINHKGISIKTPQSLQEVQWSSIKYFVKSYRKQDYRGGLFWFAQYLSSDKHPPMLRVYLKNSPKFRSYFKADAFIQLNNEQAEGVMNRFKEHNIVKQFKSGLIARLALPICVIGILVLIIWVIIDQL